jgi:uncharacterized membrane protein YfcA
MIEALVFVVIGIVGGALSGLLGIGGGVVLIPLLIYFGDISIQVAASVSIVVIIFASSSGALSHYRTKNVHFSIGIWMGVASICGALGGSIVSKAFSEDLFYVLYVALVAVALVMLLFPRSQHRTMTGEYRFRRVHTVSVGLLQGFVMGILGIGGGFLVIPLMIRVFDMPIHQAVGTSLFVTFFSAVAGFIGKITVGHYDLHVIPWVVLGAIPGAQIGSWLSQRSSPRLIRFSLVVLLVAILARMIWGAFFG